MSIPLCQPVSYPESQQINHKQFDDFVSEIHRINGGTPLKVQLYVSTLFPLKVKAVREAIESILDRKFKQFQIEAKGFVTVGCGNPQSVGLDEMSKGANKRLLSLENLSRGVFERPSSTLKICVSIESGVIEETVEGLRSWAHFEAGKDKAWVDRSKVVVKMVFNQKVFKFEQISEGYTVPKKGYHASKGSDWQSTIGKELANIYECNPQNWQEKLAGKCQSTIIKETIIAPWKTPECSASEQH